MSTPNIPPVIPPVPTGPFKMGTHNVKLLAVIALVVVSLFAGLCTKSVAPPKAPVTQDATATLTTAQVVEKAKADLKREIQATEKEKTAAEQFKAQTDLNASGLVNRNAPFETSRNLPIVTSTDPMPQSLQSVAPQEAPRKRTNIALSYRKEQPTDTGPAPAAGPASPELNQLRALIEQQKQALARTFPPSEIPASPQNPAMLAPVNPANPAMQVPAIPAKQTDEELTQSVGPKYRVFEDTVIETDLLNSLNGTFAGQVLVQVVTDVYSHDHQQMLIPQGTKILGDTQRVATIGQQRLAVTFHRMVMPDGYSETLDQFPGLNQIGETGLKGKTDYHFFQVFGTSIALGLIQGFSLNNTGSALTAGGVEQYRQGISNSLSQSSQRILDSRLNILPTVIVSPGTRVKVLLRQDLELPAYANHRIRKDI